MSRPKTSQSVINLFTSIVDEQDKKGLQKYGKDIDAADGYEWNRMALEEAVDGMKYLVKENKKLVIENDLLHKQNEIYRGKLIRLGVSL